MIPENMDDYFEMLILSGAVEVAGLDENGEFLYAFTEKMQEVDPQLKENVDNIFFMEIRALWQLGFVNMDISESNPTVTLTEKIFDAEATAQLPDFLNKTLQYLIRVMSK